MEDTRLTRRWIQPWIATSVALVSVGATLNYTSYSLIGQMIQVMAQLAIVLLACWWVDLKKYTWILYLMFFTTFLPLLGVAFGLYQQAPRQVLIYISYFSFSLIYMVVLAENFYSNIDKYVTIWQMVILVILIILLVINRDITLNIGTLIQALIEDERDINSRVAMGFNNVNQLGSFSGMLMILSLYQVCKKKYLIISIVSVFFSFVLIMNSGSRTPLLCLTLAALVATFAKLRKTWFGKIIGIATAIVMTIIVGGFLYLVFWGNVDSNLYQAVDEFTSYRVSLCASAMTILSQLANYIFGIGPMSSTNIRGVLDAASRQSVVIDNSIIYYVFSNGIVGAFGVVSFFIYLIKKMNQSGKVMALVVVAYFGMYTMFENSYFAPNSAISILGASLMFMFVRLTFSSRKGTFTDS
ncbi:hypothetical protein LIQ99_10195 [Weissella cibaria]|uniref:hypothetical protein n=1 Tax=Weissella cibaria TaxID=137591 RepID=UPI001D04D260|nr:hypothetical protein [Weissella cibaria]MCB5827278.1 hypothetical protein [Weissella cibaria]MCB5858859.1 hypothetical protein [Weissella cibaria]MCB5861068.1 hypothetical protein [Weissella cibaria]MCB5863395.1 hypothetical protein [Weissella cibaria]MCB5865585.1 hypothetical protein [Weissella cibaria]